MGRRIPHTAAGRKRTHCPAPKGGGQADEAGDDRDESATQDKVLYPLHGLPRICDDRALKVAEVHPRRPAASRVLSCETAGEGTTGHQVPGIVGRSYPDRR